MLLWLARFRLALGDSHQVSRFHESLLHYWFFAARILVTVPAQTIIYCFQGGVEGSSFSNSAMSFFS